MPEPEQIQRSNKNYLRQIKIINVKEQDAIFKHRLVGGSSPKWPENVAMSFWE